MPKWLIIGIVLILNHILWIFFAHVMKCIAEKNENYWDFKADPFESLGAFFFPLFVYIFSALSLSVEKPFILANLMIMKSKGNKKILLLNT